MCSQVFADMLKWPTLEIAFKVEISDVLLLLLIYQRMAVLAI
jgi:hypothetical protein